MQNYLKYNKKFMFRFFINVKQVKNYKNFVSYFHTRNTTLK